MLRICVAKTHESAALAASTRLDPNQDRTTSPRKHFFDGLLGGGGVDGAIHRAAGPELLEACRKVEEVRPGVRCPTGEARITAEFELPAKWVIHTVGPIYQSADHSAPLLRAAYRSSLNLANERGLESIAFPAISCGVYRYPLDDAARIAIDTCHESCSSENGTSLREVHVVLFGVETFRVWDRVAAEMLSTL